MEFSASQLIKLYLQKEFLIGNIYYAPTPEARLLDALNGIVDRNPIKMGRFLELSDVTVQHIDGGKEKLKVSYVNKSTVQLAVTLGDANSGRGIGAQKGSKSYPYVDKTPIAVRIETQDYQINGNMYRVSYQKIWHVLEDTHLFLPLTNAHIRTNETGTWETYPFIAVNKEHILSLQEESEPNTTST